MLHIILMVLKILGILILGILGLGLCIGLLVLFCPIRYRFESSLYGKPEGHIQVSWLLRLICVTISYQESRFAYKLCIFGIPLRKRKRKEQQVSLETENEEKKKKFLFLRKQREKLRIFKNLAYKKPKQKKSKQQKERQEIEKEALQLKTESRIEELQYQTEIETEEELEQQTESKIDKEELEQQTESKIDKEELEHQAESKIEKEELQQHQAEARIEEELQQIESKKTVKRKKDWQQLFVQIISGIKNIPIKIKEILNKIISILVKIKKAFFTIKTKLQELPELLRNLNKKRQAILTFIRDEKNKEAFRYSKGKLFQLLYHVLPGKVTLKLHYGFSDPAVTGILTGMISMFYPESAEKLELMPDFEKRVLEGEVAVKGRVRLIKVCWILLSIYFHKECNRVIKMIIKRKKM
ncbi:MAG: DUF2953 domain-containing protein [Lachnospiraceae bacterium]|nr:DUF2953 domain-containing protein [Lachnospiraceae bacterium]